MKKLSICLSLWKGMHQKRVFSGWNAIRVRAPWPISDNQVDSCYFSPLFIPKKICYKLLL